MYVGGLDIGTTGCKVVLFDENGAEITSAYQEYEVNRSGGLHEIDGLAIFEAVKSVFSRVASEDIKAVAVTSFGETFVMVDENDAPCAPSMLYTDPRGEEECAALVDAFGAENMAYKTGAKVHSMYSLPKIMWMKKNMPENYEKAKHILLMQDFVVYMLSGVAQIDYSLAARTLAFDIKNKCWDEEILAFAGVDSSLLSKPVPSGTAAGTIKAELAKELGLSENLLIVSGCHDQIAAMTGSGVFDSSTAMDGTGTVECVPIVLDAPPESYELYDLGYSFEPHINGKYVCIVLSYAGGATLKWFRDNISAESYKELDEQAAKRPSGLLILPHFAGAATPYMNSSSKAAIFGLTFEHSKTDIYRGLMEGTAYEIRVNCETMDKFGMAPKKLIATGGGARSDLWLQIKADILGVPITALEGEEIGAAGTAYLAGLAVGIYENGIQTIKERKTFYPDPEAKAYYDKEFVKYRKVYDASQSVITANEGDM